MKGVLNFSSRSERKTPCAKCPARPIWLLLLALLLPCIGCTTGARKHRPLTLGELPPVPGAASVEVAAGKTAQYAPADLVSPGFRERHQVRLGIVEFDDQGMLRDELQLKALVTALENRKTDRPLLLVFFVHGWNHDASPRDSNLQDFRDLLKQLHDDGIYREEILGVYLGWRGREIKLRGPKGSWQESMLTVPGIFTFGKRKHAAERVGRLTCTETILTITAQARLQGGQNNYRKRTNVKSIVVGHSFGGLVVERSFVQAMLGYSIMHAPTEEHLRTELKVRDKELKPLEDRERDLEKIIPDLSNKKIAAETAYKEKDAAFSTQKTKGAKKEAAILKALDSIRTRDRKKELAALLNAAQELRDEARVVDLENLTNSQAKAVKELPAWLGQPYRSAGSLTNELRDAQQALEKLEMAGGMEDKKKAMEAVRGCYMLLENRAKVVQERADHELQAAAAVDETKAGNLKQKAGALKDLLLKMEPPPAIPPPAGGSQARRFLISVFTANFVDLAKMFGEWAGFINSLEYTKAKAELDTAIEKKTQADNDFAMRENELKLLKEEITRKRALQDTLRAVQQEPPANLIILVNPASEAIVARQMRDVWGEDRAGKRFARLWDEKNWPQIISFSSEGDKATRKAFPIGTGQGWARALTGLGSQGEKLQRDGLDERLLTTHTAPHLDDLQTHFVTVDDKGPDNGNFGLKIEKIQGRKPSPMWIVKADKKIVTNHGDVINDRVLNLVLFLIRATDSWKR